MEVAQCTQRGHGRRHRARGCDVFYVYSDRGRRHSFEPKGATGAQQDFAALLDRGCEVSRISLHQVPNRFEKIFEFERFAQPTVRFYNEIGRGGAAAHQCRSLNQPSRPQGSENLVAATVAAEYEIDQRHIHRFAHVVVRPVGHGGFGSSKTERGRNEIADCGIVIHYQNLDPGKRSARDDVTLSSGSWGSGSCE